MARKTILDGNLVVNVVEAGDGWSPPDGLVIGADGGEIGDTWDGAQYISSAAPPPADLDEVRAKALRGLDSKAESVRLRHVTPGSAMALVYREKFEQAKAVIIAGQAAADAMDEATRIDTYPTLAASVGIEAPSLWQCGELVVAKAEAWADLSYAIERARLSGKAAVKAAADVDGVRAAYEGITWPSD